jgi:hypothetical protein
MNIGQYIRRVPARIDLGRGDSIAIPLLEFTRPKSFRT